MTASIADYDLSAAIISSIKEGTFPDSEDVLTAELPATALPTLLEEVSEARQQLEVERQPKKLLITLGLTVHYI
jgi:centromere/kinetochore protein ZW10